MPLRYWDMSGSLYRVAEVPEPGPGWFAARQRARLSQIVLSRRSGVDVRTIRNLERPGNRDVRPAIRRVVALELWIACNWQDPFAAATADKEVLR